MNHFKSNIHSAYDRARCVSEKRAQSEVTNQSEFMETNSAFESRKKTINKITKSLSSLSIDNFERGANPKKTDWS